MTNSEKRKPSEKAQEHQKKGGRKTVRALLAATLLGLSGGAKAQTPFEEASPVLHPFLTPTLVEPQHYHGLEQKKEKGGAKKPEESPDAGVAQPEILTESAINRMQKGTATLVEHFLNPSFRLYLEKEKKGPWLDAIKGAIQNFDQLAYQEKGDEVEIAQRPGSPIQGLPPGFKIVIRNHIIEEINGEKTDKSKFTDWNGVVQKISDYTDEVNKNEIDPLHAKITLELEELGEYSYFNLDKFFLEYLRLRGKVTQEEAKFLKDNHNYGEAVAKSGEHKPGNGTLIVKPFKMGDQVIVEIGSTVERDFQTLLNFSPDGHLLESKNEGESFEPKGEKALFAQMVREKGKENVADLPPTPSPLPTPQAKSATKTEKGGMTKGKKPEKTNEKEESASAQPEVKKGLRQTLVDNPKLINTFIEDPEKLMQYLPKTTFNKAVASRKLVDFILENKNHPWAQAGIAKLKKDVNGPDFHIPSASLEDVTQFYKTYFSDMPIGAGLELGYVVIPFF